MKFPQHLWQTLARFCHHADAVSESDSDDNDNVALGEEKQLHNYTRKSPAAGN